MAATNEENHRVDLVCEGGGVKGVGLAGAFSVLEEQGWAVQNIAGTSAGAITAALIAAGYSSAELKEIVFGIDFRRFQDRTWEARIPTLGKPLSILIANGIHKGDEFIEWMRGVLAEKGIRTFGDLRTEWDDPKYRSKLQVIASDVTKRRLLILPRDAAVLGLDQDELEVALAIRMSMSIPIFFKPVRVPDKDGKDHLVVDGGMLSNFPVWLFDSEDHEEPEWPTFGMLLVEPSPKTPIGMRLPMPEPAPRGARGLMQLLTGMLHTMMEAHDRLYLERSEFARTIPIPTLGVGTTEFDLSRDRKQALYDSGRKAAEEFLATWDFASYLTEFRRGKPQSRRREITDSYQVQRGAVV